MKNDPARAKRARVVNAVLMLVAFALLALTIVLNREQIREVFARPIHPGPIALGFALYFLGLLITFVRWFLLVRALGLPFQLRDAVRLGFIGVVFNLVIPGAIGGDVVKGAFLCREQTRKAQAISSIVIDRILGLLGLFLLAGLTGLWAWSAADPSIKRLVVIVWIAILSGLFVLGIAFTPAMYRPLNRRVASKKKLKIVLLELEEMATSYRSRIGVVGLGLVFSIVIHTLNVLAFYLVSQALFPRVPTLAEHLVITPLVLFTTAVPLPFGALGLSEQASWGLFQLVGHPGGAIAMMGFRLLMYAGALVSLVVYWVNLRQVQGLTQGAKDLDLDQLVLEAQAEVDPS